MTVGKCHHAAIAVVNAGGEFVAGEFERIAPLAVAGIGSSGHAVLHIVGEQIKSAGIPQCFGGVHGDVSGIEVAGGVELPECLPDDLFPVAGHFAEVHPPVADE